MFHIHQKQPKKEGIRLNCIHTHAKVNDIDMTALSQFYKFYMYTHTIGCQAQAKKIA